MNQSALHKECGVAAFCARRQTDHHWYIPNRFTTNEVLKFKGQSGAGGIRSKTVEQDHMENT